MKKKVKAPIPNSQHRPIKYQINAIISPENVLMIKCYNFKKSILEKTLRHNRTLKLTKSSQCPKITANLQT